PLRVRGERWLLNWVDRSILLCKMEIDFRILEDEHSGAPSASVVPRCALHKGRLMRILVVNVNTTDSMTQSIGAQARAVAEPGTEIVALTPFFGADSVEGNYESYLAAIAVMDRVLAYDEP